MNLGRRTFIAAGVVALVALGATRLLPRSATPPRDASLRALDADGESILRALVPALLAGALPDDPPERAQAIVETVKSVDGAILGLPQHARNELSRLFTLLASAPGRATLARNLAPWDEISVADAETFLERLRTSRWSLLRAAYDALHQLVFASWYGHPRAWTAIGYGGPPSLA